MRLPSRSSRLSTWASASGSRPSSSSGACRTSTWYCEKAERAPTYDGPSATITSPGSQNIRASRSNACCDPTVTTTSSPDAWIALPPAVLERGRTLLGQNLARDLTDDVEGQRGGERHAAREADHLRAGCNREEGADLGSRHRPSAVGVAI